jgi:hypothetical protein
MTITNGNWSRIGDLQLGFGMKRFSNGDNAASSPSHGESVLWRLQISRGPSAHDVLVDVDALQTDLIAIKNWCDKALKTLQTDGGRTGQPSAEREEQPQRTVPRMPAT